MKDTTHQAVARRLRKKGIKRGIQFSREASKNTKYEEGSKPAGPPVKSFPHNLPIGRK